MKTKKISVLCIVACMVFFAGCADPLKDGTEQLENKQYQDAVGSFEEVIKSGKNLGEAYHGQGIAYWELKQYDKAKEALKKALENEAEETVVMYQILGDCSMILGSYEDALAYYWKGMGCEGLTENQLQEMLYNEIIAYEQLRDWDSAKLKMAAYAEKYPDDEEAKKEAEFLETR